MFEPRPPGLIIASCYSETVNFQTDIVRIVRLGCPCSKQMDAGVTFLKDSPKSQCGTALSVIAILVSAVDELIRGPITRDYMETQLHKAMQRSFVHAVTMK